MPSPSNLKGSQLGGGVTLSTALDRRSHVGAIEGGDRFNVAQHEMTSDVASFATWRIRTTMTSMHLCNFFSCFRALSCRWPSDIDEHYVDVLETLTNIACQMDGHDAEPSHRSIPYRWHGRHDSQRRAARLFSRMYISSPTEKKIQRSAHNSGGRRVSSEPRHEHPVQGSGGPEERRSTACSGAAYKNRG